MAIVSPVEFLPDTPTLESAIDRIERQFIMDGHTVRSTSLRGYGRFTVHTDQGDYVYEWSHTSGTRKIG